MRATFLDNIIEKARCRVDAAKNAVSLTQIRTAAENPRTNSAHHPFRTALARNDRINIIAEIKRASPSKGVINANFEIKTVADAYEVGGAAAISVLTEPEYFGGSVDDLQTAARAVSIPILRKDFIIDEYQVYEAAVAGADAVLLIVAGLPEKQLVRLMNITQDELGMDALVEVHTVDELKMSKNAGARIVGVNNRDLKSLEVSLDVSRRLIEYRAEGALMVSESGIGTAGEIAELSTLGFNAFLIGETLMRADDIAGALQRLTPVE